jgi:hypothetical protein
MSELTGQISELPEGWAWSTIGSVAELNPAMSKSELSDDDPVSVVPMASVAAESGLIDTSDVQSAGPLKKKSFRQFADGDVLVAKITPSMENGKGAVARGLAGGRGFGSTEFHVLRPLAVEADYLLQFVIQSSFRADTARNMTGTAGQLRVPADYLRDQPIPVPPLPEQRRIVAATEEHFSSANAAVLAATNAALRADQLESLVEQELVSGSFEISGLEDLAEVTVDCLHSTLQGVIEVLEAIKPDIPVNFGISETGQDEAERWRGASATNHINRWSGPNSGGSGTGVKLGKTQSLRREASSSL